jgi:glycosyltransferase involved in cell wall biosynthesis
MSKLRIGIVARVDNGGLGSMTYDFWKNIPEITKELVVAVGKKDEDFKRYPKAIVTWGPKLEAIDEFLKDIDMALIFETPYNWNVIKMARDRGIKTVLIPMYEWTNPEPPIHPDMYLCPSLLDFKVYKDYPTQVEYLQAPVDRKKFPFKLRKKAKMFVFNNGNGGSFQRNGYDIIEKAIPLVKSDVKFIVRSQVSIYDIPDDRIKIGLGNFSREELYGEGDVLLAPHKFNGLSLPIQEALSSGMPVLGTNMYPYNTFLPKEWMFEADRFLEMQVRHDKRKILMANIEPEALAKKIDEYANKDIEADSKKADEIAQKISWEEMYPKYIKLFKEICGKLNKRYGY